MVFLWEWGFSRDGVSLMMMVFVVGVNSDFVITEKIIL